MNTTTFGFDTTAEEAIAGRDLSGIRAIVTGGTSGIGAEAGRVLAGAGAEVTPNGGNREAGGQVIDTIRAENPRASVQLADLDLSNPSSIDAFASSWTGPLHLLI